MQSFKRQIYKFGLIEDNDKNPPTVDGFNEEYTTGIFTFIADHFTNNFQDPDSDSYELTRIRTLPSVGTLTYAGNPVDIGFVFSLANVANLTYEISDDYMITSTGYCKFDKPISTIISEQETEGFDLTYLGSGRLEFEKITTSSIPNDTDIYAFFDATSMKIVDAQAAQASLLEWYDEFVLNNTLFTGNLYILPIVKENWLDFPNIILRGSSDRVRNNSDRPNDDFMSLAILPPNFDVTSNNTNPNWISPTKVVTLAFIDEVADGSEAYHKNRNGYGLVDHPMPQYLLDYKNFVDNYNNFTFFKGILYPIPDIEYGNYNNIGNAMVLQGFAAIEGAPKYTLLEIENLGVTFAEERRFHWHLDPTNPYYTGLNTTIANPYSEAAQTFVPNANYVVKGLKEFGWAGVYDKDQPASSVFTSDTFNADLNGYLEGQVTQTSEIRIIQGNCVDAEDICFNFQTSDNSQYNLFSNIATFCLTGMNSPIQVEEATPPTVDSINRSYDKNLYQLVLADFTNNFSDPDGDSYKNIKLLSGFSSSKSTPISGLKNGGVAATYPLELDLVNVSNLTFQIESSYRVANNRLIKFTTEPETLINDLEIQGYSLLENQGNTLIYNRLNTSDPQNPTVEIQTIEGKDTGSGIICLPFRTSDDSSYLLYSNTANLCLEMSNDNTPPTVQGWSDVITANEFTFTSGMFTTAFTDQEGDLPNSVRLDTLLDGGLGSLEFMGYPVIAPFAFKVSEVGQLKYNLSERFLFQNGSVYSFDSDVNTIISDNVSLGYTLTSNEEGVMTFEKTVNGDVEHKYVIGNNVTTAEHCLDFKVSDDNGIPLFSNVASVCLTVPVSEEPIEFNNPPIIGDNSITLSYNAVKTLTESLFVSDTKPPYYDEELDAPYELMVLSLPLYGQLLLASTPVVLNQIISFNDIRAGLFKYAADATRTDIVYTSFKFAVSDVGSKKFSE